MDYTRLGTSGLKVSRIALGCMSFGTGDGAHEWALDDEAAAPVFRAAVEHGVTFWDTANVYSAGTSEEVTGRAIKEYSRREDVVLATKVFNRMRPGPNAPGATMTRGGPSTTSLPRSKTRPAQASGAPRAS